MAVSHRGAISFGMVHIPVGLYTATQDNDIHFNQLCKQDGSRVKYKKVCGNCGKEVSFSDIVKGFEYEPGKFVTMTDDDFEKTKTENDRSIHILHFTDLRGIRPVYFDKTYHSVPEQGGDKAYELLRRAMLEEQKIAIAKTVLGTKEKLLALLPTEDEILVETLFFFDEIKEAPNELAHPAVSEAELNMAKTLIGAMVQDFQPQTYHDETVCLLSKLKSTQHIEVELDMDELDLNAAEKKATYNEIKTYVLEHTGLKVSNLYIAQVKQKCGIIERENYNKAKSEDAKQPQCPPEKEKAIREAMKYLGMI